MKKNILIALIAMFSITSYGQYRWEVSGGITNSSLNLDNVDTNRGTGFYFNAGYGYVMGVRAKTSIVFSVEVLQRNSEIDLSNLSIFIADDIAFNRNINVKALQVGFSPKFRYLFNSGKARFRPFVNVGPTFRFNANVELGDVELETDSYEQLVIGGVYGVGFSQMIGEMFDIFAEAGVMNDFTNNLKENDDLIFDVGNSKFFDIYARVGVRFRIYDARR